MERQGSEKGGRPAISPQVIEKLIRLQAMDSKMASLRETGIREPRELEAKRRQLEAARAGAKAAKDHVMLVQKKIDERGVESKSLQADAAKLEGQLYSLKTNDEFNIMKGQIAAKKAQDSKVQDQILEMMIALDEMKLAQKAAETAVAESEKEHARAEAVVADHLEKIAAGIVDIEVVREASAAELPPEIRRLYESILPRREGVAIAAVENEICTGCDTQVRLQLLNELMSSRLIVCPHCDRILYLRSHLGG